MAVEIVPNVFCFVCFCFLFFRSKSSFLFFLCENIELQIRRKPQAGVVGRFVELFDNPFLRMCCAHFLIHKVLLANRNHWAKQKRAGPWRRSCPPLVAASGMALVDPLSPKKPLNRRCWQWAWEWGDVRSRSKKTNGKHTGCRWRI